MSSSHTPSSRSQSPGSSRSSGRDSRSDTTPSPSGGNRLAFNPHRLTSKLALVDASESLAYAAKTLAIAAQAMSKAASSLAVASRCQGDDYEFSVEDDTLGRTYTFDDHEVSSEWQAPSYTLSSLQKSHDDELSEPDEGYMLHASTDKDSGIQPATLQIPSTTPQGQSSIEYPNGTDNTPTEPRDAETPSNEITTIKSNIQQESAVGAINETRAQPTGLIPPVAPMQPVTPVHANPPRSSATSSQAGTKAPPSRTTPKSASTSAGPASANKSASKAPSGNNLGSGAPSQGPGQTRIVLDRGFDLLPAACEISKRCAKTIYFYPIAGGSCIHNFAAVLKNNANKAVTVPSSLKADKLLAAAKTFSSATSGMLVWPGNMGLQGINGLGSSSHVQVVYLGEPLKENANVTCPRTTIILTKTEQSKLQPATLKSMTKKFKLDGVNDQFNMQGEGSILHKSRTWLRSRLTDMSFARGFYWGYILHYRKQQPKWTALELVQNANKYAEEYLLRGVSREFGDLIGPQITISKQDAKGQKLEPAIQAKILSVY